MTRRFWALMLLLSVLASSAGAQTPACDDEQCRTVQRVILDTPNHYVNVRGSALGSPGYWDLNPRPLNMTYCQASSSGPGVAVICSTEFGRTDQMARYNDAKAVIRRAVPGWCFREELNVGKDYYFKAFPHCTKLGAEALQLEYHTATGFMPGHFGLQIASDISPIDVQNAHANGAISFHHLPADADVALTSKGDLIAGQYGDLCSSALAAQNCYSYSGHADGNGDLSLTNLHGGIYHLSITAPGRKPFAGTVTIESGTSQELNPQLEAGPLSLDEVTKMLQNGVPATRIKKLVAEYGVDFALTDDSEKRLRDAGADAELLVVVAKNKR